MAVITIFTAQNGDFDLLCEDGGLYRVSTLAAATLPIGAILSATYGGNFDLAVLGGTVLAAVGPANGVPPTDEPNELFAYSGATVNVCLTHGGIVTIVPNPVT